MKNNRKKHHQNDRVKAFTLLELLIVVAVIGTLIGLLIPAIQTIRASAKRMEGMDQMKQIMLAAHNFTSQHSGKVPGMSNSIGYENGGAFFATILDFIDPGQLIFRDDTSHNPPEKVLYGVRLYMSPSDPSFAFYPSDPVPYGKPDRSLGNCSYAANAQALKNVPRIESSFHDGLSNTIALAEHYARCAERFDFDYNIGHTHQHGNTEVSVTPWERRSTFADPFWKDVVPVPSGQHGMSMPSTAGKTFQVAPSVPDCDCTIPQTPHQGGMLTAYVDGSVRTSSPSMAPMTFWSLVTPNGGEAVTDN